jgi:ribosomal protein S17
MKGIVISNKMTNAITVAVYRTMKHQIYKKSFKVRKKYHSACSNSANFPVGSEVEIVETRPISKTITTKVVE